MYIRDGQPFDIGGAHVIDGMQYPAGSFFNDDLREELGVHAVPEPVSPQVGAAYKAVLVDFAFIDGQWQPQWKLEAKSAHDIFEDSQALAAAKLAKRAEINTMRNAANNATFPHLGELIQCDALSRSDIDAVANHIALTGEFPPDFPGGWLTLSNTFIPMPTPDDFRAMYSSMTKQGTANFARSQALKTQVIQSKDMGALTAIVWEQATVL